MSEIFKYSDKHKQQWKDYFGFELDSLSQSKVADLVRTLNNHFKHNGKLQNIISANLFVFSDGNNNKGITDLSISIFDYCSLNTNHRYSDLEIKKIMYDLGMFCDNIYLKIKTKHENK